MENIEKLINMYEKYIDYLKKKILKNKYDENYVKINNIINNIIVKISELRKNKNKNIDALYIIYTNIQTINYLLEHSINLILQNNKYMMKSLIKEYKSFNTFFSEKNLFLIDDTKKKLENLIYEDTIKDFNNTKNHEIFKEKINKMLLFIKSNIIGFPLFFIISSRICKKYKENENSSMKNMILYLLSKNEILKNHLLGQNMKKNENLNNNIFDNSTYFNFINKLYNFTYCDKYKGDLITIINILLKLKKINIFVKENINHENLENFCNINNLGIILINNIINYPIEINIKYLFDKKYVFSSELGINKDVMEKYKFFIFNKDEKKRNFDINVKIYNEKNENFYIIEKIDKNKYKILRNNKTSRDLSNKKKDIEYLFDIIKNNNDKLNRQYIFNNIQENVIIRNIFLKKNYNKSINLDIYEHVELNFILNNLSNEITKSINDTYKSNAKKIKTYNDFYKYVIINPNLYNIIENTMVKIIMSKAEKYIDNQDDKNELNLNLLKFLFDVKKKIKIYIYEEFFIIDTQKKKLFKNNIINMIKSNKNFTFSYELSNFISNILNKLFKNDSKMNIINQILKYIKLIHHIKHKS